MGCTRPKIQVGMSPVESCLDFNGSSHFVTQHVQQILLTDWFSWLAFIMGGQAKHLHSLSNCCMSEDFTCGALLIPIMTSKSLFIDSSHDIQSLWGHLHMVTRSLGRNSWRTWATIRSCVLQHLVILEHMGKVKKNGPKVPHRGRKIISPDLIYFCLTLCTNVLAFISGLMPTRDHEQSVYCLILNSRTTFGRMTWNDPIWQGFEKNSF